GVARWCGERGRGVGTPAGVVPIVVGAVVYDLGVGHPEARPGPEAGYAACVAATAGPVGTGRVGAGTGATVGNWRGLSRVRPGGVGTAAARHGEVTVGALMVVNAYGDLFEPGSPSLDGALWPADDPTSIAGRHTTLGVVATNAALDKAGCFLVAQSAHDGLARALEPAHTRVDGDAVLAAAAGGVQAPTELVRALAARAVASAIRSAVAVA
ncbi:MAG: P1 family peptidase, partial [Acidimicrobiales bacterium]